MWHSKRHGFTLSARFSISLRSKKTKMVSEKRKRDSQWSVSTKSNHDVIWYYSLQVTWYPCDVMAYHNSQSKPGDERGLGRSKRPNLCCLSTFTREQTFHVMYCVQWGAHATTSPRRRRRRQRWVLWAKQQCRCITFYRHCTTMTWDLLTRHFVKSMNTCRRIFLFSFFALNAVFSVQLQQNLPLTVKLTEKNANAFY